MTTTRGERRIGRRAVALGVLVAAVALLAGVGAAAVSGRDDPGRPARSDYVDFEEVRSQEDAPEAGPDASTGSFASPCGRNEGGHRNWDNVITAPGELDGARHLHEYVGNVSTDAFATDGRLASAGTTCGNGDASSFFWPALRALAKPGRDELERYGNQGAVLRPASVVVGYRGNATSKVVPMPRFLRAVTGDSRAATANTPAGSPRWSCGGLGDRHTALYPLCAPGQLVVRTFDFPSCWDGRRTDSQGHRSHVVFPAASGACPRHTFPIPQLRLQVSYSVPAGRSYAIDSFPEQRRSPRTDHADLVNVMPEPMMARVVECINDGLRC